MKKLKIKSKTLITLILINFTFENPAKAVAPGIAGTLSVIPGLGQIANGDILQGLGWFAVVIGGLSAGEPAIRHVAFDLWQYNMYDAYQSAGAQNTAKYNVYQNYISAFNFSYITDPYAIGILGVALAVALVRKGKSVTSSPSAILAPPFYAFVGLGEEGLFRGFLFPGLSDLFSSKLVGAVLSSAMFSAAHMISGSASDRTAYALGFRFIAGLLFCIHVNGNKFDLRPSIFTHAWYDVIIDYDRRGILDAAPKYGLKIGYNF